MKAAFEVWMIKWQKATLCVTTMYHQVMPAPVTHHHGFQLMFGKSALGAKADWEILYSVGCVNKCNKCVRARLQVERFNSVVDRADFEVCAVVVTENTQNILIRI